jgi:hypothetical protein
MTDVGLNTRAAPRSPGRARTFGSHAGMAHLIGSNVMSNKDRTETELDEAQATMIERDLVARGITDQRVLGAMGAVRREHYVPAKLVKYA